MFDMEWFRCATIPGHFCHAALCSPESQTQSLRRLCLAYFSQTAKERGVEGRNKDPGGEIFVLADSYIAFVLQYGLDAFVLGYVATGEDYIEIQ